MNPFILLGVIGPGQVILIVAIILLLFGGRKIPELMKGLGEGIREFKKASKLEEENSDSEKKPIEKP
ncbi:MAG: twin-arginine translocase TatA/TatE family subunit [Bacteroidales bacterium]|nr:twin-arginine translocase TatA/TatE family subunit [Bacteroidales bacterium]HQH40702.1 twin-arginine translocase TatA/TatE family subunit [Bacteroidales bacterium]HQK37144.1 twin-arginine translocase TatA/TatE family subunit [Bacteroidales bacterium]